MNGEVPVKRISSPTFIKKVEYDKYEVEVKLNQKPDSDWIKLFKDPSEYKNAHPRTVGIVGAKIIWTTSENNVKEDVEWLDKYIEQANEKYAKMLAKTEEKRRKEEENEKQKEAELDNLTQKYKGL